VTNAIFSWWEDACATGAWATDGTGGNNLNSASNFPSGITQTLNGTYPDALFQVILDQGGIAGATIYPLVRNGPDTGTGDSLTNGLLTGPTLDFFASELSLINSYDGAPPVYAYPLGTPEPSAVTGEAYQCQ
jgi:hypothetical protein